MRYIPMCPLCGEELTLDLDRDRSPRYIVTCDCGFMFSKKDVSLYELARLASTIKFPRKDKTPFTIGDRVYEPKCCENFGVIKEIDDKYMTIYIDNFGTWRTSINCIFHADDPCLRIFGVEPEDA